MRPRAGLLAVVVAAAAAVAGCGSAEPPAPTFRATAGGVPYRGCAERATTALPVRWRARSISAGPLAFHPARALAEPSPGVPRFGDRRAQARAALARVREAPLGRYGARLLESWPASAPSDRYAPVALDVVVERGGRVTISLPARARRRAALLPLPPLHDTALPGGRSVLRLEACPDVPRTVFDIGLVVTRPGCVPFDFYERGRAGLHRVVLSFGAGRCPAALGERGRERELLG